MKCLFIPDNLFAILCEEQRLFQSFVGFQFKQMLPYCKLEFPTTDANRIKILPPKECDQFIARACIAVFDNKEKNVGMFILGFTQNMGAEIINAIPELKMKAYYSSAFELLECSARYTADLNITHKKSYFQWNIENIKWEK